MNKKYDVKETGRDFWGNKKYEVTEKSSNNDTSSFGILLLILAIVLMPSGSVYLLVFLLYPKLFPFGINLKKSFDEWQSAVIKNSFYITAFISICAYIYLYRNYCERQYNLLIEESNLISAGINKSLEYDELRQANFTEALVSILKYSGIGLISYIITLKIGIRDSYWEKFKSE
jgi:hypothetical protein